MIDYRSFNLIVENGQADAGQDGQTRLARPCFQALTGTGNMYFPFQLTTRRIGNLTRLIYTLLYLMSEDPTAGSVILAGIPKKIGSYGFLCFSSSLSLKLLYIPLLLFLV